MTFYNTQITCNSTCDLWLPIWRSLNQLKGVTFFRHPKKSHQQKSSPNFHQLSSRAASWSGCRGGVRCRPCIARNLTWQNVGVMNISHLKMLCRLFNLCTKFTSKLSESPLNLVGVIGPFCFWCSTESCFLRIFMCSFKNPLKIAWWPSPKAAWIATRFASTLCQTGLAISSLLQRATARDPKTWAANSLGWHGVFLQKFDDLCRQSCIDSYIYIHTNI